MKNTSTLLLIITTLLGFSFSVQASDSLDNESLHNESQESEGHEDEGTTHIYAEIAKQVGIQTALTGPQSLQQTVTSYGRLITGPEQSSNVRARFPGVIQSIKVMMGDQVNAGDLLAVIESNESLKRYELRAPIAGIVLQQYVSAGEMTQDQVLFSLANLDSLWVELRVFPSSQKTISAGNKVNILADTLDLPTTISHLIPAAGNAPYLIARAKIDSASNTLFPGLMVEGRIVVGEFDTALAVANAALQKMDGETGVFRRNGESYTFTPLVLGRIDSHFTEVLSGIDPGVEYVVENSYLIKADIEKSEAEHEH